MSKKAVAPSQHTDLFDAIFDGVGYGGLNDSAIISDAYQEDVGCPICGSVEYRNIHRERWGVCSEHLTKWPVELDCSSYCHECPAVWEQNMLNLANYTEVVPVAHVSLAKAARAPRKV